MPARRTAAMRVSASVSANLSELTTTSVPFSAAVSESTSDASAFTAVTLAPASILAGSRATAITACPRETSSFRIRDPAFPDAPTSATFIPSSSSLSLRGWFTLRCDGNAEEVARPQPPFVRTAA